MVSADVGGYMFLGPVAVIPCLPGIAESQNRSMTFPNARMRNFESSPSQAAKAAEAWIIHASVRLWLFLSLFLSPSLSHSLYLPLFLLYVMQRRCASRSSGQTYSYSIA